MAVEPNELSAKPGVNQISSPSANKEAAEVPAKTLAKASVDQASAHLEGLRGSLRRVNRTRSEH